MIDLKLYHRFRSALTDAASVDNSGPEATVHTYQKLVTELPTPNQKLLSYLLDMLAVFADKSELNKMTPAKLAAIFQPGLLSHPEHCLSPNEQQLSQDVLIFLIENQDIFLTGMAGTAVNSV